MLDATGAPVQRSSLPSCMIRKLVETPAMRTGCSAFIY